MHAKRKSNGPNPIAARIEGHARGAGISLRELSRRANLSESTAQKVIERLNTGAGDVGMATLTALAEAMGRPLVWLLYGDVPPPPVTLRDLPGWAAAAREAIERLGCEASTVDAVGAWVLHEPPKRLDAFFVEALARAWRAGA